jgi:putative hydrolase of the HAD superfamily
MTAEEDMFEAVVHARRAGYRTALLSNSWGLSLYPRDRFPDMFDVVVISGEVGLRKPDPNIFNLTTDKLGIAAERCIFVDDHPGHLKGALEVGMTTVLHRAPKETIEELEGLLQVPLTAETQR